MVDKIGETMATKVNPSSVEPRHVQSTVSISTSSTVSASSPKVSMLGAKSGFVIPKNKLSGSLVPIFRGGKVDTGNTMKEESIKQVQRKTKWGTDLTQDAVVRKGRALAYQTRVEQITQQLKAGALDIGDDQGSQSPKQASSLVFAGDIVDNKHSPQKLQSFESLDLEKREIIGEILRLNPNYKAPPDYKPLLKEAKVPIPVKSYPGNNFIGLLLGPENNTQKRLEEGTGAKIRVHGTKTDTGEKCEITQADIHEAQGAYEELHVIVSADTYDKIDAAVALIELLVTQVSGSSVAASTNSSSVASDKVSVHDPSKNSAQSGPPQFQPYPGQGVPQPMFVPAQSGPPQYQTYRTPWFPIPPSPSRPPSGFLPVPFRNNTVQFPPSQFGPVNVAPYFAQAPPFGSFPRTSSPSPSRPQLPMQVMQQQQPMNQAYPHQHRPMPAQQPPPSYPVMRPQPGSTAALAASQPMFNGSMAALRPVPVNPQPLTTPAPPQNPAVWATAPPTVQPLRPNMAPPSAYPLNAPNAVSSRPPAINFAPPATFASRPTFPATFSPVPPQIRPVSTPPIVPSSPLRAPVPLPSPISPSLPSPASGPLPLPAAAPPASAPVPRPHAVPQVSVPSQSVAPVMVTRPPSLLPSLVHGQAVRPIQPPAQSPQASGSSSGSMPSFSPVRPATTIPATPVSVPIITAPRPLRPSSGDFTFQPTRAQVPASPTAPLAPPQAPSFRPAPQNPTPPVGSQRFPWPSPVPPPSPTAAPFSVSPSGIRQPPRLPFPNPNSVRPMSPATQMGPPSFSPAPRGPNLSGPMHAPPANPMQPHPNQLPPNNRPNNITIPNQQLGSNPLAFMATRPSPSPGGNQIYDPFSPSSITPQQGGDPIKARKPETDAEYEDLMASVGVK